MGCFGRSSRVGIQLTDSTRIALLARVIDVANREPDHRSYPGARTVLVMRVRTVQVEATLSAFRDGQALQDLGLKRSAKSPGLLDALVLAATSNSASEVMPRSL